MTTCREAGEGEDWEVGGEDFHRGCSEEKVISVGKSADLKPVCERES